MRASDIFEQHIYYVNYNDVRRPEFDGEHLSIVIKKNNDKKTAIVVPLTRSSNGEGGNKKNLSRISTLPNNLRTSDSYVVYDQVRTVNLSRFKPLLDDNRNLMQSSVNDAVFAEVVSLCSDELFTEVSIERKINYHYSRYRDFVIIELLNLSYDVRRKLQSNSEEDRIKIAMEIIPKIKMLLSNGLNYANFISPKDKDNGILGIIEKCLNDTILNAIVPISEKATG